MTRPTSMVRPVLVCEGTVLVFYPGLGARAGPKLTDPMDPDPAPENPPPFFLASPNDLKVEGNEKQGG
jgi:hypothetical protein